MNTFFPLLGIVFSISFSDNNIKETKICPTLYKLIFKAVIN